MSSGMMPGYFNGGAAINKQAREWTLKTVSVNESTNQSIKNEPTSGPCCSPRCLS